MTNEQIINALECCAERISCDQHCPYWRNSKGCDYVKVKVILDLINRQKAEIERLQAQRDKAVKDFTEFAHIAPDNPFACIYCVHSIDNGRACEWKGEHEDEELLCFGKQFVYRDNLVKEMVGEG